MNLFAKLERSKEVWFLLVTSFFFFLLRLPSLYEPNWYGDEGIYQTIGMAMQSGRLLYTGIWDNKPPLLYILYSFFDGDQFGTRLLSLIFGLLSIIVFFFLAKCLFAEKRSTYNPIYITTAVFAFLFAIPLLEGNIANSENFMLLPLLSAALLLQRYIVKPTRKALVYIGLLLSFAFLLKIVAVFDVAAFSVFLFIILYKDLRHLKRMLSIFIVLGTSFLFPILLTLLFFVIAGAGSDFITATFKQNVGYVGYGNTFIIPQGFLYLKLILLSVFLLFLFIKRERFSKLMLFLFIWMSFSLFDVFFSQRPYTHYMLMLIPSFSLFLGLLFIKERTNNLRTVTILIVVITMMLLAKNFTFYKKNIAYYGNFLLFVTNQKSLTDYQAFFDRNTPKDYALAQFLRTRTHPKDIIFLWGNNAQVYKLSQTLPPGKYTVEYHINASKQTLLETAKTISEKSPKYVVIFPSTTYPFSLAPYRYLLTIQERSIYERIY